MTRLEGARLAEAFATLTPEDQQQYLSDLAVYGQAGIFVDQDGRARLVTAKELAREQQARAQSDPAWGEKIRKGEV